MDRTLVKETEKTHTCDNNNQFDCEMQQTSFQAYKCISPFTLHLLLIQK